MTRNKGTWLGAGAIAAWSCYGVLVASNEVTPPFRAMAVVFTCATMVLLLRRLLLGHGVRDLFKTPPLTALLGFTGLFGTNCLYVVALALGGAPVPVNIASLSWPIFMMALLATFGLARATWLDGAAMLVGFAGVILLTLQGGEGMLELNWPILVTTFGAFCWAVYSAFRPRVPAGPQDAMIVFVGLSGICCWIITALFETGSVPTDELLRLALVGLIPVGLANLAWDLGTRHGDPVLLAGLSFLGPVLSTLLIALVLEQTMTLTDWLALALVMGAVSLSLLSKRRRARQIAAA